MCSKVAIVFLLAASVVLVSADEKANHAAEMKKMREFVCNMEPKMKAAVDSCTPAGAKTARDACMKKHKTDEASLTKIFCNEKRSDDDIAIMKGMHGCMKSSGMKKPTKEEFKKMKACVDKKMG